jgi:hypothetical protein
MKENLSVSTNFASECGQQNLSRTAVQPQAGQEQSFTSVLDQLNLLAQELGGMRPNKLLDEEEILTDLSGFALIEKPVERHLMAAEGNSQLNLQTTENLDTKPTGNLSESKIAPQYFTQTFEQVTQFSISFPQAWLSNTQLAFNKVGNDWRLKIKSSSVDVEEALSMHTNELSQRFSSYGLGQVLSSTGADVNTKGPVSLHRTDSS